MRIVNKHSHLNGLEFMLIHAPSLWKEVEGAVSIIQCEFSRIPVLAGLHSNTNTTWFPTEILKAFECAFIDNYWTSQNRASPVLANEALVQPFTISFLKNRVSVSIHLTESWELRPEIHTKHLALFQNDLIDVGIEIVPTKALHDEMLSGVPYYEGELYNLIREGRGVPAVPLVLVGIEP